MQAQSFLLPTLKQTMYIAFLLTASLFLSLLQTVSRHFRNIPVNEKETLTYFIYMVKSSKSRLDQKGDGGKPLD